MIYRNSDLAAILVMERARTGNYGEDCYSDDYEEDTVQCGMCGCDIANTRTEMVFCYGNHDCLCDDCFNEVIFDDLADECGTPLDEWEG